MGTHPPLLPRTVLAPADLDHAVIRVRTSHNGCRVVLGGSSLEFLVVVAVLGIGWALIRSRSSRSRAAGGAADAALAFDPQADANLADREWFEAAFERHQALRSSFYGPPEVQADAARTFASRDDVGVAVIFAQRALNTLEDLYVFGRMESRRPSPTDQFLVDTFVTCVDACLACGREEAVRRVAGAGKRNLRRCGEAAESAGLDPRPYYGGNSWLDSRIVELEEGPSM